MTNPRKFFLLIATLFIGCITQAQPDKISGKVLSGETNSPLAGASVVLEGSSKGVSTDVEGRFFLPVKTGQTYHLTISSVGFVAKTIENVTPGDNALYLEVVLQRKTGNLQQVVVTTNIRKESVASLYAVQRASSAISDGISAEIIKRSPDKNAGDVLKRVSGASVQDNKFVVIRGMNERYNVSLLNNSVLPSTEADKKAFAFNILPASLVDNLIIYKAATPDLPGDFSGGAVKVMTKDYPTRRISELAVSIGYNSLTTNKNFYKGYPSGSLDALGFLDNSRLIPGPYYRQRGAEFINNSDPYKKEVTKMFSNTFGFQPANKSLPNISASYTAGNTRLYANGNKLGYIWSLGYSNGRNVSERKRDEYVIDKNFLYEYNTTNYEQKDNLSALLNLTWSYGRSKISLKNLFNNDFSKTLGIRSGYSLVNDPDIFYYKSSNSEVSQNGLVNSVLEGLHRVGKYWTLNWAGSFGYTYKNQPDQKILSLRSPDNVDGNYYLRLSNENSPEIRNAGRVYSFLGEKIYGASADAAREFKWLGQSQKLKFGTMNYYRDRSVEVDALGYASLNTGVTTINESKEASFNNIFSAANIDQYNLTVANIGTNSTDYTANALLNAGYAMLENKFSDQVKLTWGARVEKYRQELSAKGKSKITNDNTDILPSLLFTWSMNPRTNLRFSGSQAVNRPEFRELADYSIYDYDNYFAIRGNPSLQRCKNTNADLRYEFFPAAGEVLSASVFYKYFKNPIEQTNEGNDVLSYANADHASVYGVELEIRKKLDFTGSRFLDHLTVYANTAFIKGNVKFGDLSINSPMQGQSPYLVNGGLTYLSTDEGFAVNVLYNRIGPRLRFRAKGGGALNIFERPRDVLDFQVSKKLLKNRLELKLTVSDLFAQAFQWYYKYDPAASNTNYKASDDKIITAFKFGTTGTLSVRFDLSR